ncbi:MAG: hypothetical protein LBR66_05940 [Candidatus Symbiothrix sp.]|jgi:hypothetical protein|nr:hypothetical protein [Candidatus Symbiothrix sp.]
MNTPDFPLRFQDETTGKYGFRNSETGETVVAPEYEYVSEFSYSHGQYRASLGDHQYLTPDGQIHTLSPEEI